MIENMEPRRVLSSVSTVPDSYTAFHNQPYEEQGLGVCSNDTGSDGLGGSTLTAAVESGPSHGSLNLNSDGSFTYTPDDEYVGADSFTYTASIGGVTSAPETVTFDVFDYPPTISGGDTSPTIHHDTILVVTSPVATAADDDDDAGDLTLELVTDVSHGVLDFNADGTFTYTPAAGYYGLDSFSIRSADPHDKYSAPIDVNIYVLNYPPTLNVSSSVDIPEGIENGDFVQVATATDDDGDTLTFSLDDPSGIFTINDTTGVITVANDEDIVADNTYTVTVSVTDGEHTIDAEVDINVIASTWKITGPSNAGEIVDATTITITGTGTGPIGETQKLVLQCLALRVGGIAPPNDIVELTRVDVTADPNGDWTYTLSAAELATFKANILSNIAKKGPLKMRILGKTTNRSVVYKFTPP